MFRFIHFNHGTYVRTSKSLENSEFATVVPRYVVPSTYVLLWTEKSVLHFTYLSTNSKDIPRVHCKCYIRNTTMITTRIFEIYKHSYVDYESNQIRWPAKTAKLIRIYGTISFSAHVTIFYSQLDIFVNRVCNYKSD